MKTIKNILKFILNGGKKIKPKEKKLENISRPCPDCGEELNRMDRCQECYSDLTYHNGICYSVDHSEAI